MGGSQFPKTDGFGEAPPTRVFEGAGGSRSRSPGIWGGPGPSAGPWGLGILGGSNTSKTDGFGKAPPTRVFEGGRRVPLQKPWDLGGSGPFRRPLGFGDLGGGPTPPKPMVLGKLPRPEFFDGSGGSRSRSSGFGGSAAHPPTPRSRSSGFGGSAAPRARCANKLQFVSTSGAPWSRARGPRA